MTKKYDTGPIQTVGGLRNGVKLIAQHLEGEEFEHLYTALCVALPHAEDTPIDAAAHMVGSFMAWQTDEPIETSEVPPHQEARDVVLKAHGDLRGLINRNAKMVTMCQGNIRANVDHFAHAMLMGIIGTLSGFADGFSDDEFTLDMLDDVLAKARGRIIKEHMAQSEEFRKSVEARRATR